MQKKKVLITGASGLLGGNLMMLLPETWGIIGLVYEHPIRSPRKGIEILSFNLLTGNIEELFRGIGKIDAVIHTAALTNVDLCEEKKRQSWDLNAVVTQKIVEACKKSDIHLIHISTDHVFDGKRGNYKEEDIPHPVNYYAETKLAAEEFVKASGCHSTIIRTNFFGFYIQRKRGIAGWILNTLKEKESLTLFTDVRFSSILVNDFVPAIAEVIEKGLTGVLHIASKDSCTKYEFGIKLANAFNLDTAEIIALTLEESHLLVPRPKDMSLDTKKVQKLLSSPLPTVDQSIARYKQLMENEYPSSLRKLAL